MRVDVILVALGTGLLPALPSFLAEDPPVVGATLVFTFANASDGTVSERFEASRVDTGANVADETFTVRPGETFRKEIPAADTAYDFSWAPQPTGFTYLDRIDPRGCGREFDVPFAYVVPPGFIGTSTPTPLDESTGCRGFPVAAVALAAEPSAPGKGRAVDVGAPRIGDHGRTLSWLRDSKADWNASSKDDWRLEEATFPDASGVAVRGNRIAYTSSFTSVCSAGASTPVGNLENRPDTTGLESAIEYVPLERLALAESGPVCASGFVISGGLSGFGERQRGAALSVRAYGSPSARACYYRSSFQGARLVEGGTWNAADPCPGWAHASGASWRIGEVATVQGVSAIPATLVTDEVIARVWLAPGVSVPILAESWRLEHGYARHWAFSLTGFAPGNATLPTGPAPAPAPNVTLAPIDPMKGPSRETDRLPFPLDEASTAALADPLLTSVAKVTGSPGAFLASATMSVARDAGVPIERDSWTLSYAAPGGAFASATCERPVGSTLAHCSEDGSSFFAPRPPSNLSAADVPRIGASFGVAIARWRDVAPENASERVTYASYRAWDAPGMRARIGVGVDLTTSVSPVEIASESSVNLVTIGLVDGKLLTDVRGAASSTGLGSAPEGVPVLGPLVLDAASARPAPARPTSSLVVLAGSVIALALVLLLFALRGAASALFTRLTRARVLDQDTRREIRDLVAANPGIHQQGVVERFGRGNGLVEYHLSVLVRERVLVRVKTGGFRRYFLAGSMPVEAMQRAAALAEGRAASVIATLRAQPGLSMSELARASDMSIAYASRETKRLETAGLLRRERDGKSVRLYVRER